MCACACIRWNYGHKIALFFLNIDLKNKQQNEHEINLWEYEIPYLALNVESIKINYIIK